MAKAAARPRVELVSIASGAEPVVELVCRNFDVVLSPAIEQSPFKDR